MSSCYMYHDDIVALANSTAVELTSSCSCLKYFEICDSVFQLSRGMMNSFAAFVSMSWL